MKKLLPFLIIAAAVTVLYLPILLAPSLVLDRGNDLEEFFWPLFHFVKQQILENHQFPLWNNLFLSGMPLLPDPQSPLFYPPNIIFLTLPIGVAFIISFILHTFLGGIGMFLLARSLGTKQTTALFAAILYICTPKLFGYLEAGHFGLFTSFAWIPFVFLGVAKLVKSPNLTWSISLALFFAAIFYTHILTFLIAAAVSVIIIITLRAKSFPFLILAGFVIFGLTAIALMPQLEWLPYTTRQILFDNPEVFPQWNGTRELIQSIFWPWGNINQTDSEKWIPLGITTVILSLYGFLNLSKKIKIAFLILGVLLLILNLNNLSPFYSTLLEQKWFVLLRVTTRTWFITNITTILLAAYGLELLSKKVHKNLLILVAFISIAELFALSYSHLNTPVVKSDKFAQQEVYEYLRNDSEKFRVFCVNRCLSQKEAALANLELIDGYNTIQQINFYKQAWQLTGAYWNYYTLSIPPIGTYTFEKPQPDARALGEFNTKYVISPYELTDKEFSQKEKIGDYHIYQNDAYLTRAYFQHEGQNPGSEAKILEYSPNYIKVDVSKHESSRLVLSEVWNSGWSAYLNGKDKVTVQEKPNTLRLVDIKSDTQFVDFKYEPIAFKRGVVITAATVILITFYSVGLWRKSKRK